MDRGHGQKRRPACRKPLRADDQAAVLFLHPGQRTLRLEAGDLPLEGAAPRFLGLPDAFGDLRPDAAAAELLTEIFRIVKTLHDEGLTVFLVEQNVTQTLKVADYGYVLENGRIVQEGTGAQLEADPKVREAYLGF